MSKGVKFWIVIATLILIVLILRYAGLSENDSSPITPRQEGVKRKSQSSVPANEPLPKEQMIAKIKSQAQQMLDAMSADDYEKLAEWTIPTVIMKAGGLEKWTEAMKVLSDTNKQFEVKIGAIKVGEPRNLAKGVEDHFGILPYDFDVTIKGSRSVRHAFVIGVSSDGGRTWKFMEGTSTRFRVKQLIPDFPDDIELPKT